MLLLCAAPGGGPEILSVLLEGESLFNDASSLTLYEIFHEVVTSTEHTTLAHDLQKIVRMTVWSAFTGVCIGVAFGIVTRWAHSLGRPGAQQVVGQSRAEQRGGRRLSQVGACRRARPRWQLLPSLPHYGLRTGCHWGRTAS